MMDPGNRKEGLDDLRPERKDLDTGGKGDAAREGYSTVARRPRVRGFDEIVETERADRIEEMLRPLPGAGRFFD